MTHLRPACVGLLLLAGCSQPPTDSWQPALEESGLLDSSVDCSVPLSLEPESATVNPYGLVSLVAAGGSGSHRFELVEDASGATLNSATGAYVAGPTPGEDRVELWDEGCDLGAEARITVVEPLSVLPTEAEIPPGTALIIERSGGSGELDCALAADASGASLGADCSYTAGSAEGVDILRFTDRLTEQEVDVVVEVDAEHRLQVAGHGRSFLLVDHPYLPWTLGGTGELSLEVVEGPFVVEEGSLRATGPGAGRLRVVDRYAPSLSVEFPAVGVEPVAPELPWDGERSGEGVALALGDVNGDGWPDAALGFIELSVGAYYSGAAAVYAGGPTGLDPAPVWTVGGSSEEQTLGRALAVGDVDADGEVDLLVGADRTDFGSTNNGAVYLYRGIAGGFFEIEPSRSLYGTTAYSRFGSALAVCDFDADGWLDLAVGAREAADETVAVPADDQGAVHIFRGSAEGFADEADFELYGVVPDAKAKDGWSSQEEMELGTALVAADFDGDGLCDLAAGAPSATLAGDGEDGVVLLYRGTLDDDLLLQRSPDQLLAGEEDGDFGRRLAAGDVDGDGRADLAVSEWTRDDVGEEAGAVALFYGGALGGAPPTQPIYAAEADWRVRGSSPNERLGGGLDLDDLDGDGLDDLIVGAYRAEVGEGVNEGVVWAWWGSELRELPAPWDATGEPAGLEIDGPAAYARMGQAVAGIGDVDGGGRGDLLALAGYDDVYGIEAGAPYFLLGLDDVEPALLEMPGGPAGHDAAQGLAVYDVDGDGWQDLLLGSPGAGSEDAGANAGMLHHLPGSEAGLGDPEPTPIEASPSFSASDRRGHALAPAGDVDGDGWLDLAVVARKDSAMSSLDAEDVLNPEECPEFRSQAGSLTLYRGGPEGLDDPILLWFSPESSGHIYELAAGFDHDGDGLDDLAVGSWNWGEGGGLALIYGQPAEEGLRLLCDTPTLYGASAYDRLGDSLAALGDVDGDGCDELAVGASGEQFSDDYFDQGVVRVLWGHGGPGCPAEPEVSTLTLDIVSTQLGTGLAGGGDVDGDGLPDLVVGGSAYRADFAEIGGAWLVPGWWLREAARDPLVDGQLPEAEQTSLSRMLPEEGLIESTGVRGRVAGGLFGETLALVPDPEHAGRSLVAIAAPLGDEGGVSRAGGVQLWRAEDADGDGVAGFGQVPWGVVSGETAAPGGELGLSLAVGQLEVSSLVVGAPRSDVPGMDHGAAYVCPMEGR